MSKRKKELICPNCNTSFETSVHSSKKNAFCVKCSKEREYVKHYPNWCPCCWLFLWKHYNRKICNKKQLFKWLHKYFGFDLSKIWSFDVIIEFYRIEKNLRKDYFIDKLSIPDLIKKYWYYNHPRNFSKILDSFWIKKRSAREWSDLKRLSWNMPLSINKSPFPFKQWWHTTRNWNQEYLRSSYETDIAEKLDFLKIKYITENPVISYIENWKERMAYPDFYLPDHNILIEVKSTYFRNKENMELKFKAYEALWYKCVLIVDKKVVIWENYAIEVWMYPEEVMAW